MARTMTFQVNDASTDAARPAVSITLTENADGTLSFKVTQEGGVIGDLRGLFFDVNAVADGALARTLSVSNASAASAFKTGDDSIKDMGNGANMNGLTSSNGDGGFDAGISIGSSGLGADDIRSFSFTLSSSARALTLDDFANVDFGVRLTSVGTIGGARSDSAKLLETTSAAINAFDDQVTAQENSLTNGSLLTNDTNKLGTTTVTGWTGGAVGQTVQLQNAAGATLVVNADGTYSLDTTAADALSEGETLTYTFGYDARSASSDQTSSDSASFTVTITGKNDGPSAGDDVATANEDSSASGQVLGNDSDIDRLDTISVKSWSAGELGQAVAIANGEGATVVLNADGSYSVDATAAQALSAGETVDATFTYTIADNHGATATASLKVSVTGANDGPVALDDNAGAIAENETLTGNAAANDSDIDRLDTHTWALVEDSFNGKGSLVFNQDGSWSYDAKGAYDYLNAGEKVELSFAYVMTDDHGANDSAIVSFQVEGVGTVSMPDDDEKAGGPQGNNGWGNNHQPSPGNSGSRNNAENAAGDGTAPGSSGSAQDDIDGGNGTGDDNGTGDNNGIGQGNSNGNGHSNSNGNNNSKGWVFPG